MNTHLLELVIVNLPNFAGLFLLVYMQWRIIQILMKKVDGHEDDDDDD